MMKSRNIFKLFSPGNVRQSGVPLEDGIEEGREGNQEGGDQDEGKEDIGIIVALKYSNFGVLNRLF